MCKETKLRKRILWWLFGTDDIDQYMYILRDSKRYVEEHLKTLHEYVKEIEDHKESLHIILKLIKICENHGIDVDEEIKHIALED